MVKRIRVYRRIKRTRNTEFTSVGILVKTKKKLVTQARKEKVPIYQHVDNLANKGE